MRIKQASFPAYLVLLWAAMAPGCADGGSTEGPGARTPDDAAETSATSGAAPQAPVVLPAAGALDGYNLLLLTVDTLRADALGAYGGNNDLTPHLDRLASEGIRFGSAFAHTPMTLPSHSSILTGEYPFRHGVRDNGAFRLDASRVTLAEMLQGAGYRTGAFVGAFVLDYRFGLAQGFDRYDDYYGETEGFEDFNFTERSAEEVLSPAASWIEEGEDPWFAWAHLFDPHVPYEPPAPYRERHRQQPYLGEVAYVDQELGRFLDRLRNSGALDNTLIIFTADHGESLGEHGEQTHGVFAYNSTLQVPLLVWGGAVQPGVFSDPVSHVDIVPTVLELLGLPVPGSVQGTSLVARLAGAEVGGGRDAGGRATGGRPIYFEALNGYLTQNLAPLTGVIEGDYKFIDLPVAELYHLPTDPQERDNLYEKQTATALRLRELLKGQQDDVATATGYAPSTTLDPSARRRLEALGYLASSAAPEDREFTAADDPKNVVHLIDQHRSAMASQARGAPAEAVRLLRDVLRQRPDFTEASVNLATILHDTGRLAEAVSVLETASSEDPASASVVRKLGFYLAESGELARAVRVLEAALEQNPDDIALLHGLGITYGRIGRQSDARGLFTRALGLDPSSASTQHNVGMTYLQEQNFPMAIEHFRRAIELTQDFWLAYDGLGNALALTNQSAEAVDAWKMAVELNPQSFDALYNLGIVLADLGRDEEALVYLDRFAREAPPGANAEDIAKVRAIAAQVRARIRN